jgi:hypothetical protein
LHFSCDKTLLAKKVNKRYVTLFTDRKQGKNDSELLCGDHAECKLLCGGVAAGELLCGGVGEETLVPSKEHD